MDEDEVLEDFEGFDIPESLYTELRPHDKLAVLLISASDAAYSTKEIAELIDYLDKKAASSSLKIVESKG